MKKNFLLVIASALLSSCSTGNNNQLIEKVNVILKDKYSEIEAKDIKITQKDLSDREAINELFKRAGKEYELYESAICLKEQDSLLKILDTLKGNTVYHKVEAVKANPDTTTHAVFYFDNKDNLIKSIYYK